MILTILVKYFLTEALFSLKKTHFPLPLIAVNNDELLLRRRLIDFKFSVAVVMVIQISQFQLNSSYEFSFLSRLLIIIIYLIWISDIKLI